jgi:hypothetical protein
MRGARWPTDAHGSRSTSTAARAAIAGVMAGGVEAVVVRFPHACANPA